MDKQIMPYAIRKGIVESGKITFIVCTLSFFCLSNNTFCQENRPSPKTASISIETVDKNEKTDLKKIWQMILGKKARDALLLGMWSIHLKGSGEYFGNGDSNEQNHLLGIQYYGLAVGTFINSYDDRSWFFGPVREVYSRKIYENTRLDFGYKLGLLYGYEDHLPNVGGISLFGAGTFGVSWHRFGVDIMIIPVGVISGGFRIDID